MPQISVIVPVYNIKSYLDRCVQSLIKQSFDDYEIILVDDGSSDGSELLCDHYDSIYEKVKVIHKKNGGLSDARNCGLKYSKAKYVIFVDSDDYVDSNYVSYLFELVGKYNADVAVSGFIYEKHSRSNQSVVSRNEYCVNSELAFQKMCYGKEIPIMAWGKIMHRNLALKHLFPYGVLNEDVGTVYKLLLDANKVAIGNKATYHYVYRPTSILHSANDEKFFYGVRAAIEILNEVEKKKLKKNSKKAACGRILIESIGLLHRTSNNPKIYKKSCQLVRKALANNLIHILFNWNLSISRRMQIIIFLMSDSAYRNLYLLRKR